MQMDKDIKHRSLAVIATVRVGEAGSKEREKEGEAPNVKPPPLPGGANE